MEYDPERDASPPCDSRESGGAGAEAGRGSDGGERAAKRRRPSGVEAPEPDRGLREGQEWGGRVWVWDLDETLILFNSVLTRTFLQHQHLSEAASLVEVGAGAFAATGLEGTLVIPSRVRKIGSGAFWYTRLSLDLSGLDLSGLDLSGETSLVEIGERAFAETNLEATVGPVAVAHAAEEGREIDSWE